MAKNKPQKSDFDKFLPDDEATVEVITTPGEGKEHISGPEPVVASTTEVAPPPHSAPLDVKPVGYGLGSIRAGTQLQPLAVKEGTDPLLVRSFNVLRNLQVGGLISPYSGMILNEVDELLNALKKQIEG